MSSLEAYRKLAKQLVRWHRAGNYSIGGRIRGLPRYRQLTDGEALKLKFPLSEAQEIIAREAGFESWTALKAHVEQRRVFSRQARVRRRLPSRAPRLLRRGLPRRRDAALALRTRAGDRAGIAAEGRAPCGIRHGRKHQSAFRRIQDGRRPARRDAPQGGTGRPYIHGAGPGRKLDMLQRRLIGARLASRAGAPTAASAPSASSTTSQLPTRA